MLFNPGTGTLKSVTYEAALVEAAQLLELAEEGSSNPASVDFTEITHNNGQKTTAVSCSLPITVTLQAGQPLFIAADHVAPTFVNTGSDVSEDSLCGAVLELAQTIQAAEKSNSANPNRINIQYNTDTDRAVITASFPSTKEVNAAGAIVHIVTPYLA